MISAKALNAVDRFGQTVLTLLPPEGEALGVAILLRKDLSAKMLNSVTSMGKTSFSRAAEQKMTKVCLRLLDHENFNLNTVYVQLGGGGKKKGDGGPSGFDIAVKNDMHSVLVQIGRMKGEHLSKQEKEAEHKRDWEDRQARKKAGGTTLPPIG